MFHFTDCSQKTSNSPDCAISEFNGERLTLKCCECGATAYYTAAAPDSNVEANREALLQRSIVGLKKYGVTTERKDLNLADWLQHGIEEVLDLANYLQAAKNSISDPSQNLKDLIDYKQLKSLLTDFGLHNLPVVEMAGLIKRGWFASSATMKFWDATVSADLVGLTPMQIAELARERKAQLIDYSKELGNDKSC